MFFSILTKGFNNIDVEVVTSEIATLELQNNDKDFDGLIKSENQIENAATEDETYQNNCPFYGFTTFVQSSMKISMNQPCLILWSVIKKRFVNRMTFKSGSRLFIEESSHHASADPTHYTVDKDKDRFPI